MLTPIFRKYKKIEKIIDEVVVVETENGPRNKFRGRIYENQQELDEDIQRAMDLLLGEVGNDIDNVANMFIETRKSSYLFSLNLLKKVDLLIPNFAVASSTDILLFK